MIYIYNSLTKKKEIFKPILPGKIGIYVCGSTVYDHCHLGHARSMVCFDTIIRFLKFKGFSVNYIRNITDVDDKIINRAKKIGISIYQLTDKYIKSMEEDSKSLNILPPNKEPRVTQYIDIIINSINKLINLNYAYINKNGDIYYRIDRFKSYGKLSKQKIQELLSINSRNINIKKKENSILDFVLWKNVKQDEPSWISPWGNGRPGWHIECSAISMYELGEQFDIHGGGIDLEFPHHENEIAQSEAMSGKQFVNYWLHIGMLQINKRKMAKSLGNSFTIRKMIKQYHPEVIRYFLLSSHYRSVLNFSEEKLRIARRALIRLYRTLYSNIPADNNLVDHYWVEEFNKSMSNDFNTPSALSILFKISHIINKNNAYNLIFTLKYLASILGILQIHPKDFLMC